MNKTKIEWVKNPDGSQGYTWNPITGCLNGCEYCYARKLANGRLKSRYLANQNIAVLERQGIYTDRIHTVMRQRRADPFYPRFWEDRIIEPMHKYRRWGKHNAVIHEVSTKGIFVCDMSDLFGIGIPYEWTERVLHTIRESPQHRFYLLTKQPQNLIKFSPFPDNCWVGVTATDEEQWDKAIYWLGYHIQAKVKFISIEPFLKPIRTSPVLLYNFGDNRNMINQVIIGAQTKPKKLPKWEWVKEIIDACDKAGIPVFLKNNLGLPKLNYEGAVPFYKKDSTGTMVLRQEMPTTNV